MLHHHFIPCLVVWSWVDIRYYKIFTLRPRPHFSRPRSSFSAPLPLSLSLSLSLFLTPPCFYIYPLSILSWCKIIQITVNKH